MNPLMEQELQHILKTYKIDKQSAEQFITKEIESNKILADLLNSQNEFNKVSKTSVYKMAIKKIRKDIYYSLRTYRPNISLTNSNNTDFLELAKTHISTNERLPYLREFNEIIIKNLADAETLIDIGGGLEPLIFPFEKLPKLQKYIWMDKDKEAAKVLQLFAKTQPKLRVYNDGIGDKTWEHYLANENIGDHFDTALMFKLIPVVSRQNINLIENLINVPAKQIAVTASKEAMTKHSSIERRENIVLQKFISQTNRKVQNKFEIQNEFGYILT